MKSKLNLLLFWSILLIQNSVVARVHPSYFKDLVDNSDVIVIAKVIRLKMSGTRTDWAKAKVLQTLKGNSPDTVQFRAYPTFPCDGTTARMGETAMFFLRDQPLSKHYEIESFGRGRITTRTVGQSRQALLPYGVVFPSKIMNRVIIDTIKIDQNRHTYFNYWVEFDYIKDLVKECMTAPPLVKPDHFMFSDIIPPDGPEIRSFIKQFGELDQLGKRAIYDCSFEAGQDTNVLKLVLGTPVSREISGKAIEIWQFKYFRKKYFVIEQGKLLNILKLQEYKTLKAFVKK
jgi:hypothetical protein